MITTTQIKSIKDKIKLFTGERHLYDNRYKIGNIKYLLFGKYTREFQDFSSIRYSQYANYTLNELCELADLISSFDIFIKEFKYKFLVHYDLSHILNVLTESNSKSYVDQFDAI